MTFAVLSFLLEYEQLLQNESLDNALRLETLNAHPSLGDFSEARECLAQFYSKGKCTEKG